MADFNFAVVQSPQARLSTTPIIILKAERIEKIQRALLCDFFKATRDETASHVSERWPGQGRKPIASPGAARAAGVQEKTRATPHDALGRWRQEWPCKPGLSRLV